MRGRIIAILSVVVAAAACGGSDSTTAPPSNTNSVDMTGNKFSPVSISVARGSSVTWTNKDNTPHNVTFSSSSITSIGDYSTGSRSTTMPQQAGTFSYRCTIHAGMDGSVVVQ